MISFSDQKTKYFFWGSVILLYFGTHLFGLLKLPVFADEAIYIRWSQLILDDWKQYFFFPLNDGKTPLFIWLLTPILTVFNDPLWAGRFLSTIIGFFQLIVIQQIVKSLGGKQLAQVVAVGCVTFLPFWFFFHRLALIDGLLALCLSVSVLGTILLMKTDVKKNWSNSFPYVGLLGISFGAALLTKLPALFFMPIFPLYSQLFTKRLNFFDTENFKKLGLIGVGMFIGLVIFGALKLHPAFGQLFSRGQDFTFTVKELLAGEWRASFSNLGKVFFWHGSYFSFSLTFVALLAPLFSKFRRIHVILLFSLVLSALPFIVFARVFSPRYILPIVLFSTVSVSLFFEELFLQVKKMRWILVFVLLPTSLIIFRFLYSSWFNINTLALVPIDREQYLEEWSAGQGIREMSYIIADKAKQGRVVVATEGYFGTLPDGLLMYFHNQDVSNIEIFGVGQPITELPEEWLQKAEQAQTAYLLVNTHRMLVTDSRLKLVHSFPRPGQSSSLDVYELQK